MNLQLSHKEHAAPTNKFPIVLLTDNLMGEANIGSLFRLADAFNIEKIVFCGSPVNLSSNRLKRTARSTITNVENEFYDNSLEALSFFENAGYNAIALELTIDSIPIENKKFDSDKKIVLVIGNERNGISEELLKKVKTKVHINMFGKNSSMNVSHATGIAFYEITKTLPLFPKK